MGISLDIAERASWTFAQSFMGALVSANVVTGTVSWPAVLISAGVAAVAAVLKGFGVHASTVLAAGRLVDAVAPLAGPKVAPLVQGAVQELDAIVTDSKPAAPTTI